jgi:periplasmic protein CpxP/Spy
MNTRHPALAALALATALAGGVGFSALTAQNAAAQATTAPQQTQQEPERHHSASRHIDGRIAFLKTELKITDAQGPLFEKVANVMRENAKAMGDAAQSLRGDPNQPRTAIARLEARAKFAQLRADSETKMLAAFRPLYQAMSPDQQKAADEMFEHHGHGHFGRG